MGRANIARRLLLAGLITIGSCLMAGAQTPSGFAGRLSWVPISGQQRALVGGSGMLSATLTRSALTISGSFDGLPAAAVSANLHAGVATGARGPAIAELEVTHAAGGTISGEIRLDRGQLAALRAGRLYVQLNGETGVEPDNAILWGWLLAEDSSR